MEQLFVIFPTKECFVINLSNGHYLNYVVASGALGFDGKGYLHEWPLRWAGLIQPELFDAVFIKSLTRHPVKGNLNWWNPLTWLPWSPWSCVRFVDGDSVVNKVGLTNPGIDWWCNNIGPLIGPPIHSKTKLAGSIFGDNVEDMVYMAKSLNAFPLIALEVNVSCPNTGHSMSETDWIVSVVKEVKWVSRHPVILKLSVAQDYVNIVRRLDEVIEAVSLNSVPWHIAFQGGRQSPLSRLEKKVGGGGGGVSGRIAQRRNWEVVERLAKHTSVPVIGPSVMRYEDIARLEILGASAISFGAVHVKYPWRPTQFVRRRLMERMKKKGV